MADVAGKDSFVAAYQPPHRTPPSPGTLPYRKVRLQGAEVSPVLCNDGLERVERDDTAWVVRALVNPKAGRRRAEVLDVWTRHQMPRFTRLRSINASTLLVSTSVRPSTFEVAMTPALTSS